MKKLVIEANQKQYPLHSAGRIMNKQIPIVTVSATIGDARTVVQQQAKTLDTINYVYVVNSSQHLVGVFSIREIFIYTPQTEVQEIMETDLAVAHPYSDQERVAQLALKHNIKAIPIIAKTGELLGIVPSDHILAILEHEFTEDVLRSAGIMSHNTSAKELITQSAKKQIIKRLPWLILGLLGGIAAAFLVQSFDHVLKSQLILAAFIPAVVYMADATGGQAQTLFIRSITLDPNLKKPTYFLREMRVAFMLALILGILVGGFAFLWQGSVLLGLALATAIVSAVIIASVVGIFLPWMFMSLKLDPAISSGPFATVIRDITTLTLYFFIAQTIVGL